MQRHEGGIIRASGFRLPVIDKQLPVIPIEKAKLVHLHLDLPSVTCVRLQGKCQLGVKVIATRTTII